MRSASIRTTQSPKLKIFEYLQCSDFNASETFDAVKNFLDDTVHGIIGPRLKLRRIPARGINAARASIVLVPGQHVQLHDGTVCLYVGSYIDADKKIRAMVINYRYFELKRSRGRNTSACIHPGAKLPWLERCNSQEIRSVKISHKFFVSLLCQLFVSIRMVFLLVHGIFNWNLRKTKERPCNE